MSIYDEDGDSDELLSAEETIEKLPSKEDFALGLLSSED